MAGTSSVSLPPEDPTVRGHQDLLSGSGLRVPCSATSSGASSPLFLVVGNLQAAGLNGLYEGMCSVTVSPFNRVGNGVVTLTDASGLSTTYNLGLPASTTSRPYRPLLAPFRRGGPGEICPLYPSACLLVFRP